MFCRFSPDRLVAERRSAVEQKRIFFLNNTLDNSEKSKQGENIMGSVAEFVYAMAALGIFRAWNAREDERNARREEEFVPFHLPPLSWQDQSLPLPVEENTTEVALASH